MVKTLEKGADKVQKICDALRKETLEPAELEAKRVIEGAKKRADHMIAEAKKEAEEIISNVHHKMEQERNVFHSSLEQAAKQTLEKLKQDIENQLFNEEMNRLVESQAADPAVISRLITALITAIEKEGLKTELSAIIPKTLDVEKVNQLLGKSVLDKLKEKSVTLGPFAGGAQLKLLDNKMTIDISDRAIKEQLSKFLRKDFRQLLFKS